MGAKNHAVVLPDANVEATVAALTGAAFGAAGQRCMAISAAVFVGGMGPYRQALADKAAGLRVAAGWEAGADLGPVISPQAKARIEGLIESGIRQVLFLLVLPRFCGGSLPGQPRQTAQAAQRHSRPARLLPRRCRARGATWTGAASRCPASHTATGWDPRC